MKAQLLLAKDLTRDQQKQVVQWLKSNGCPYMIPYDSRVQIAGNYVTVECWEIRNLRQARTLWPRRKPDQGFRVRVRKYRIRHELRLT